MEDTIKAANEVFYRAFREGDFAAMERIWASEVPVACIHPGMAPIIGRGAVMASWRGILAHPGAPALCSSAETVHVLGTSALLTCLEGEENGLPRLVATNVFTMENGHWRLCHHHGAALLSLPEKVKTKDRTLN
ncbi:MAG: ketosteroid isomerase-like protein [Polyangiales bacterium]|jgi:ketosteroid isomerase-like protein